MNKKISQRAYLAEANISPADLIGIVDVSAGSSGSKKTTVEALLNSQGVISYNSESLTGPQRIMARKNVGVSFLRPEDFGAVGDGVADDWLALQRMIAFSGGRSNAMTLTIADTETVYGIQVPLLINSSQQIRMQLTQGKTYLISRPLVINDGCHMEGEGHLGLCKIKTSGAFNAIETRQIWMVRNYPDIAHAQTNDMWTHNVTLRNFRIAGIRTTVPTGEPAAFDYIVMSSDAEVASGGASGTNTAVLTALYGLVIPVGSKLKFSGGSDTYTVLSYSGNILTTTANFSRSLAAGETVAMGFPSNNGIVLRGGEDVLIEQMYFDLFDGAGIFNWGSSPAPVIRNCMANANYIGYWIENSPAYLEKPSGDGNHIAIRAGMFEATSLHVTSAKFEDNGGNSRCIFQFGSINAGGANCYVIDGGNFNPHSTRTYGDADADDLSLIEVHFFATRPTIKINGFRPLGAYGNFLTEYDHGSGAISKRIGNFSPDEFACSYSSSTNPAYFGKSYFPPVGDQAYTQIFEALKNGSGVSGNVGTLAVHKSGLFPGSHTFTRSGTTVTFITATAHGLTVGDYIKVTDYSGLTGSGTLGYTADTEGTTAFAGGWLRINAWISNTSFSCTVTNTGPTAGTIRMFVTDLFRLHDVNYDEHRWQMPSDSGNPYVSGAPAFSWLNKSMTRLMSLLIGSVVQLWIKDGIAIGGTPGAPSLRIGGGSVAPSEAWPDGSIYFRTNGTIYQMRSSSWALLAI